MTNIHPPLIGGFHVAIIIGGSCLGQICTFFGHRFLIGFTKEHKQKLKELILDLINNHDVDTFWVSNYGEFDDVTRQIVFEIKKTINPNINICLVRSYNFGNTEMQKDEKEWLEHIYDHVFTPLETIESPPRFAITRRNKFMAENCDFMICFVRNPLGGAYKAMRRAQNCGKTVFNLFEDTDNVLPKVRNYRNSNK